MTSTAPDTRWLPSLVLLALLSAVAGCHSTPDPQPGQQPPGGGGGKVAIGTRDRPAGLEDAPEAEADPRIEVKLDLAWEDIDKNDRGEKNPEEVARWVTERRNAVQACLNNRPQALTQAVELLQEITTRVPDSSKDRYLLAQCYFVDALYWWRMTDVTAWELNRVKVDRTEHRSIDPAEHHMTDHEVDARVAQLKPYFEACLSQLDVSGHRALDAFMAYRQQRPDDKRVYDYLWKLYFYVQDFRAAKQWLEVVLHEMDMADEPSHDPLRQNYELMIEELKDKIVDERTGEYVPVRPIMRDRFSGNRGGGR
jgi:hypothetical protein